MRVLFNGDTPTVSTGFSRCTLAACGELHRAGHEVHLVGISEFGEPHRFPFKIYPAKWRGAGDDLGIRRTAAMIDALQPDVVVLLNDPWNVIEYLDAIDEHTKTKPLPPIVAWMAIDAQNHPSSAELNRLAHVICWTQFGVNELRHGGYTGSASVLPLGCDTDMFYPIDRKVARDFVLPDGHPANDGFIFGVVGRNQPRKRVDLAIECFAQFLADYNPPDAYLFLQVAPTGERGCDVRMVSAFYGPQMQGRIILHAPDVGKGVSDVAMRHVYNAFDVAMTTTQGEGWGLTTHEAMACGVPVIVPDFAALGEWPGDAVVKVPCTTSALSAPQNFFPYTIGRLPDRAQFVHAMQKLYCYRSVREEYRARGLALAQRPDLHWDFVGRAIRTELEGLVGALTERRELEIEVAAKEAAEIEARGLPLAQTDWVESFTP